MSAPAESRPSRFRVLVTGSRDWTDAVTLARTLDELHARHGDQLVIVHGACPTGADTMAGAWARDRGVPVEEHPADWSQGRAAGPARNAAMVATSPQACAAFIRDASPGATGCANLAEQAGIPTTRHPHSTASAHLDVTDTGEDQRLVAVVDGPLAGQWFTLTDWRARRDAALAIEAATGTRGPSLAYRPRGDQVAHPHWPGVTGIAATARPSASTTDHVTDAYPVETVPAVDAAEDTDADTATDELRSVSRPRTQVDMEVDEL